MILIRKSKLFAGYSESPISSISYHSSQVGNYVLDSVDKSTDLVNKIPVLKDNSVVKKKVGRVKKIIRPLKDLLNLKKEKN